MIVKEEDLDKLKKAGTIAANALVYAKKIIKPGVSLLEATDKIEEKIINDGGGLAFPTQVSLNDAAAHYCPKSDDKTVFNNEIIKVDVGAHIDGFIGDNAVTIDLGNNDELKKASREALDNAIKKIKPGIEIREIGREIQETIESYGFSPVRNLSGHGLGKYLVHTKPSMPNYDNGDENTLEENQLIAIEPFASSGAGIVYESSNASVFSLIKKKPVRMPVARKILKEIENFNGLPFTTRWLERKFSPAQVKLALNMLLRQDIINDYPPLIDKSHGMISQAEHTILVKDKPIIITTPKE